MNLIEKRDSLRREVEIQKSKITFEKAIEKASRVGMKEVEIYLWKNIFLKYISEEKIDGKDSQYFLNFESKILRCKWYDRDHYRGGIYNEETLNIPFEELSDDVEKTIIEQLTKYLKNYTFNVNTEIESLNLELEMYSFINN